MTKEELVQHVKRVMGLAKEGKLEEAYEGYGALFAMAGFATNRPEDQRQALRLMVHARNAPTPPTTKMLDAHKAAVPPLTALVAAHGDPADYEMLGMCQERLGEMEAASNTYRQGLQLERQKNPSSDLCGALMRRLSLI